ncbi:MAG: tetratricopeptide repeat protein [Prevotella sp.]|nr:tetratricopeptide repeat protein [Prevotella sp.]
MEQQLFKKIRRHLNRGELSVAMKHIQPLLETVRSPRLYERFEKINQDYQLVIEYMAKGVDDPQREDVYRRLLKKADALLYNLENAIADRDVRAFSDAFSKVNRAHVDFPQIKSTLEQFVADVAMIELEPEEKQKILAENIYKEHQEFVDMVFDAIWVSDLWCEDDFAFCSQLILSPTIDSNDALLMTSALTLSLLFHFDMMKSETLRKVYTDATDIVLKQRALVGWALTLPEFTHLYDGLAPVVKVFCEDEDNCKQLAELQMQIYFCMNAENDHIEIQRDIMPNLMKNSNLKITRFGIEEKEDDELDDILHPDSQEKAMEEVEQSFQKMLDMQKSGADIYFGGFSQMKRFPFFYRVSNWFAPFDLHHPEIQSSVTKLSNNSLLSHLFDSGPFCDSDKYSFTLAMKSVIDKIPENMREMLDNSDALGPVMAPEEINTPAYKRRMYLQDLYRFFKLADARHEFRNPFAEGDNEEPKEAQELFLSNKLFKNTSIVGQIPTLCAFLVKRKKYNALDILLQSLDSHDINSSLYQGLVAMGKRDFFQAADSYAKALELEADNKTALQGYAKACYYSENFQRALEAYRQLSELAPGHLPTKKKYCICLIHTGQTEQAIKFLYQMDFDQPGDWSVVRILAWALLVAGKKEQAQNEYRRLIDGGTPSSEDYFNAGLCDWVVGDILGATVKLKKYMEHLTSNKSILADLLKEKELLSTYGITVNQIIMMADLLNRPAEE